ncbi:MAG: hypothetical protein IJ371_03195 [Clostridia bacterium]|nr:hypothetical protein [Clostridia bacterium]
MAEKTTKTTTRSSNWGLHKLSFFTIGAAAILYLVAAIMALIDEKLATAVGVLQGFATAIMICIVAVLAWKYARHKPTAWKVLYFVFLAIVILGIIIPLIRLA